MRSQAAEIGRYVINGIVATAVHFAVLTVNIHILKFDSAGLSNFVAALLGITASFLGSRYFVFARTSEGLFQQAVKFSGLYGFIAVLHGLFLWAWTDWSGFDYRAGFLLATAIQAALSYFGNKFLVFK